MLPILIRLDDRNVYATHNRVSSIPLFFSFSPRPMTFFENLPESSFRFDPIDIQLRRGAVHRFQIRIGRETFHLADVRI